MTDGSTAASTIAPGGTLTFAAGTNATVSQENGTVTYGISSTPTFTSVTSETFTTGASTLTDSGLTTSGTVVAGTSATGATLSSTGLSISSGGSVTNSLTTSGLTATSATIGGVSIGTDGKISNLTSGTIEADNDEAVTGGEVAKYLADNYSTTTGSGFKVTAGTTTLNSTGVTVGTSGNALTSSGLTASAATINGTLSANQVNVGDIKIGGTGNTISGFTSGSIASIVSLVLVQEWDLLIAALVAYGLFGKLACDPIILTLISDAAPKDKLSSVYGIYNCIAMLGAILSPYITGWLRDSTNTWNSGFYFAAGMLAVGWLAAWTLRKENPVPA